jgi:hypothetical protein
MGEKKEGENFLEERPNLVTSFGISLFAVTALGFHYKATYPTN